MAERQREKAFENKIKNYIKAEIQKSWGFKFHADAYTQSGIPDLIYCINGRFVAIEVKKENGKPSELQKRKIKRIIQDGGVAVIVKPSQFEDLKKLLMAVEKKPFKNSVVDVLVKKINKEWEIIC